MTDQLPPEIIGHLAGVTGTNEPMEACNSCQRAIMYGVMAHVTSAASALDAGFGSRATAIGHLKVALRFLLDYVKVDFLSVAPDAEDMTDEEWALAVMAFFEARIEHYCDMETGEIIFEPHDDDDPAAAPL
ncbi:hypothetical protein [Micromonospora sp. WMMD736]|uniref:hypothetical protein n=1 Tax=Micromonospora sp. WMMD736 TaxID=3404112 RepID=UPI003B947153